MQEDLRDDSDTASSFFSSTLVNLVLHSCCCVAESFASTCLDSRLQPVAKMASLKMSVQCSHAQVWHPLLKAAELSGRQRCQKEKRWCVLSLVLFFPSQRCSESRCSYPLCRWRVFFSSRTACVNLCACRQFGFYLTKWRNHKEAKGGLDVSQRGH